MRRLNGLVSFAAVAAASVAWPVEAAPAREPLPRVGEWQVRVAMQGVCQVVREYASGSRVFVTDYGPKGASLAVVNPAWSMRTPTAYRLSLFQGGAPRAFAADAGPYAHGLGMSSDEGDRFLAQFAEGGTVEVNSPEGALLERLDLSGLGPALAPLKRCTREAETAELFGRRSAALASLPLVGNGPWSGRGVPGFEEARLPEPGDETAQGIA